MRYPWRWMEHLQRSGKQHALKFTFPLSLLSTFPLMSELPWAGFTNPRAYSMHCCAGRYQLGQKTVPVTKTTLELSASLHGTTYHDLVRLQTGSSELDVRVSYFNQNQIWGSELAGVVCHGVLSVNDQVNGPPDLFIRAHVNLESYANSWFSFLKGETIASGGRFARYSLNQKVCSWRYR